MSEIRNLTRNGETFYPLTCSDAVLNRDGEPLGIVNDIFDISEYNASGTPPVLAKYDTLSLALAAIPVGKQKGGMTIRYVQNSDNKYVQYRLMSNSFNTTASNWQGTDGDVAEGSVNLVESGGVARNSAAIIYQMSNSIGKEVFLTNVGKVKDGVIDETATQYSYTDYISIDEKSIVSLYTYGGSNYSALNFYDASKQFLSSVWKPAGGYYINIVVPKDAKYVIICGHNNTSTVKPTSAFVNTRKDIAKILTVLESGLIKMESNGTTSTTLQEYPIGLELEANKPYILRAKTTQLGTSTNKNVGFWVKNSNNVNSQILSATAEELYNGIEMIYTPSEDVALGIRTMEVGISYSIVVSYAYDDFDKLDEAIAVSDFLKPYITSSETHNGTTTTTAVEYVANLKSNTNYKVYVKTATVPSSTTNIGVWVKNGSNQQTKILSPTPNEMYTGITFYYTPTEDVQIGIRTYAVSDDFVLSLEYNDISKLNQNSEWRDSKVVLWGDSIVAQGNGENNPNSFLIYASNQHHFNTLYSRGVGGQTFTWNDYGWYTKAGTLGNYLDRYMYDAQGNKLTTVVNPSTITQQEIGYIESAKDCQIEIHRGPFCSWDRIKAMIPSTIKDAIKLVIVCGGTNDFDNIESVSEPQWVANNETDSDWANDSTYYNGGDYDITTLSGAVASTIMKMRLWCPNAVVVLATPFPKFNLTTKQQYQNTHNIKMCEFYTMIEQIANYVNVPLIHSGEKSGIDGTTFGSYAVDSTHPNEAGRKMFGRTFIGELYGIAKKVS